MKDTKTIEKIGDMTSQIYYSFMETTIFNKFSMNMRVLGVSKKNNYKEILSSKIETNNYLIIKQASNVYILYIVKIDTKYVLIPCIKL